MLQLGGMQDAMIAVPPTLVVVTAEVSVVELTVAFAGDREAQVRGAFCSWFPRRSSTVAVTLAVLPLFTEKVVLLVGADLQLDGTDEASLERNGRTVHAPGGGENLGDARVSGGRADLGNLRAIVVVEFGLAGAEAHDRTGYLLKLDVADAAGDVGAILSEGERLVVLEVLHAVHARRGHTRHRGRRGEGRIELL